MVKSQSRNYLSYGLEASGVYDAMVEQKLASKKEGIDFVIDPELGEMVNGLYNFLQIELPLSGVLSLKRAPQFYNEINDAYGRLICRINYPIQKKYSQESLEILAQ